MNFTSISRSHPMMILKLQFRNGAPFIPKKRYDWYASSLSPKWPTKKDPQFFAGLFPFLMRALFIRTEDRLYYLVVVSDRQDTAARQAVASDIAAADTVVLQG